MLYDPKWHQPPADIFALESLIAWLERQPGDQEYCYISNDGCLLAQYFMAQGLQRVNIGGWGNWLVKGRPQPKLPKSFWQHVSKGSPRTFGAALTRARAALATRDV